MTQSGHFVLPDCYLAASSIQSVPRGPNLRSRGAGQMNAFKKSGLLC
jgi:hypothetical protein